MPDVKGHTGRMPRPDTYQCATYRPDPDRPRSRFSTTLCVTGDDLDALIQKRGLDEQPRDGFCATRPDGIGIAPTTRRPYEKPLHDKLISDGCTIATLHYAIWLGFLALKARTVEPEDVLGDRGLVHEMVHVMQFGTDDPTTCTLEQLVRMAMKLELAIPGLPLTSRQSCRERRS